MAIAPPQTRLAPESEQCAGLRLVPQESTNNDVPAAHTEQGEALVSRLQMLRDSGIGLVEQFRAARGGEDADRIWHLAIDTCVALLESDDSREFNRGVQFCLGLAREQTRLVELESKLAIAGMDMAMQVMRFTATGPTR